MIENESSDYADNLAYWVYSIKNTLEVGESVTYDNPIYNNTMAYNNPLTQEIFDTLYSDMLGPSVRSIVMNDEKYVAYSQRVPNWATTAEEINFGIFFLVRDNVVYGYQESLTAEIEDTKWLVLAGIILCLSVFFLVIAIIVLFFSRAITKPIDALTNFT